MKRRAAQKASLKIAAIAENILNDTECVADPYEFEELSLESRPKRTRKAFGEKNDNEQQPAPEV